MFRVFLRQSISSLILLLVLAACAPPKAGPSAEDVDRQIATAVAMTISAHETMQILLASPTAAIPPTETITLTPTITASPLPTFSPVPTQTTEWTPPPASYACSVVGKVPADNTIFKAQTDFDIKFWIRNVGTEKWQQGPDLLFSSGTNMLTANTRYELPDVKPGQQVGPFIFDARSPKKAGTYTMTFKVQGGFCYPYIRIIVR